VEEVAERDRTAIESLYLAKHPHLAGFLGSENCALMRLLVKKYIFVSNFQQVVEMDLDGASSSHRSSR
jgi:heme iron utilization protein